MNTPAAGPIVVGIDGSAAATEAACWAAREAAVRGVPLRLVTALNDGDGADQQLERQYAETCLREASAAVGRVEDTVSIDTAILGGNASAALIEQSRTADMVVVGSVGIGRIARAVLGSTASDVAVGSQCPVAVIRHRGTSDGPALTWIAVGVGARTDDAVIETAAREARLRGAALLAVGVWDSDFGDTPYDELDRRMTEWQQRFPELHLYTVATRADLDGYLAEHPDDAGLAVLSERDADQLADIVGPRSHPLREHADCSVLISR